MAQSTATETAAEPEVPQNEAVEVEVLQNRLGTLIGPVINKFIDDGDALLIAVVVVSKDSGRRSTIYIPQIKPSMSQEEKLAVEEARAVGQFQAAIQFGKLHGALSESTNQTLRAAARLK